MALNPDHRIDARSRPFEHYVIDDFFECDRAHALLQEFEPYSSSHWFEYLSPLERKRTIREWGRFGSTTYQTFQYLCGPEFVSWLQDLTGVRDLRPDYGLHGAGWHIHQRGDHLNLHLDYSRHPRLDLQRRYNLIVYLCPDWDPSWGGALELWSHDRDQQLPGQCESEIMPGMNRAVLFDTSGSCWHGFPQPLACPPTQYRRSLAMYYLGPLYQDVPDRPRARYAPRPDQMHDAEVLELIDRRSRV